MLIYGLFTIPFTILLSKFWELARPLDEGPWRQFCFVALFFIVLYISSSAVALLGWFSIEVGNINDMFTAACSFVTFGEMLSVILKSSETIQYSERMKNMTLQLELQAEFLDETAKHEKELRKIRHDMHHHFATLETMLSHDNIEQAKAYLREYANDIDESTLPPVCENAVTDAVCKRYMTIAAKNNIKTDVAISFPYHLGIADNDLAVMLSNLWENALEACLRQNAESHHKAREKYIRVRGMMQNDSVMFSITNSFDGDVFSGNNPTGNLVIYSLKRGGKREGVGLSSVRAIVERYNGVDEVTYDGNNFHVRIILYP
jgi:sensor histidine kinase regulating citrate/malate metabolism